MLIGRLYQSCAGQWVQARFDGLELDSGTVIEFATAKMLGKPAVILRCDFRRAHFIGPCEPYNLMVKNWPRTVDVHVHSFALGASLLAEGPHAPGDSDAFQALMTAELGTLQESVDEVAEQVIAGLDAAIKLGSPYPAEYQEVVYRTFRLGPGSAFDQLLAASELDEIIQRLREKGTL